MAARLASAEGGAAVGVAAGGAVGVAAWASQLRFGGVDARLLARLAGDPAMWGVVRMPGDEKHAMAEPMLGRMEECSTEGRSPGTELSAMSEHPSMQDGGPGSSQPSPFPPPAAPDAASDEAADTVSEEDLRTLLAPPTFPVESPRLPVRGLGNTGNSCYQNAVMQALLACTPFCWALRVLGRCRPALDASPVLRGLAEFSRALQGDVSWREPTPAELARQERFGPRGEAPTINCRMLDVIVQRFAADGGAAAQEDAQEFLSYAVDHADEELRELRRRHGSGGAPDPAGSQGGGVAWEDPEEWATVGPKNRAAVTREAGGDAHDSIVGGVFAGVLSSTVRAEGARASATLQPFTVLPLEVGSFRAGEAPARSVQDALARFTAAEEVSGYRAGGVERQASKSTKLRKLPEVLVIHLQRFTYTAEGLVKLSRFVEFDEKLTISGKLLDPLSPHRGEPGGGVHYRLRSTVTHLGADPFKGHYVADVCQDDGTWLHMNDTHVGKVPTTHVFQQPCYLLFYQRERGGGGAGAAARHAK
ncbi:unnamed protein product [Pedinophyceae sp. YPF-701]|nr:unnamed protein product [Pedinophyceae sp. YPF-701]